MWPGVPPCRAAITVTPTCPATPALLALGPGVKEGVPARLSGLPRSAMGSGPCSCHTGLEWTSPPAPRPALWAAGFRGTGPNAYSGGARGEGVQSAEDLTLGFGSSVIWGLWD